MERIPWALLLLLVTLGAGSAPAQEGKVLSLAEARETALREHPRVTIAQLRTMVTCQEVIATRSAALPQVNGYAIGVGNTDEDNRLSSMGLTTSTAQNRVSTGLMVSQLITDFGRTNNLVQSALLRASAEQNNALANRAQLLLEVDTAYFAVLRAQSVLGVAEETARTRQLTLDRIRALAANKLRSELDVSFAEVNFEQANLLVVKAQNDSSAAMAVLRALLNCSDGRSFRLEEQPMPPPITVELPGLVAEALQQRPELNRLRCEHAAAERAALGERGLRYPTVSALGNFGANPARESDLNGYYVAGGVAMTMPLLDGRRIAARINEADLHTSELLAQIRDEEDNIRRDVEIARLDVDNAAKRMEITAKLLGYSRRSFDLAQARYTVGTSSIVELSQAELSLATAAIADTSARYEYFIRRANLDFQLGRTR
jgi:outer membrane protein